MHYWIKPIENLIYAKKTLVLNWLIWQIIIIISNFSKPMQKVMTMKSNRKLTQKVETYKTNIKLRQTKGTYAIVRMTMWRITICQWKLTIRQLSKKKTNCQNVRTTLASWLDSRSMLASLANLRSSVSSVLLVIARRSANHHSANCTFNVFSLSYTVKKHQKMLFRQFFGIL